MRTTRGARLTAQLLAFSRQQILAPRAVAVPKLVSNLVGMLTQEHLYEFLVDRWLDLSTQ
jgi:hypothetical protein